MHNIPRLQKLCQRIAWTSSVLTALFGLLVIFLYHTGLRIPAVLTTERLPPYLTGHLFLLCGIGLGYLMTSYRFPLEKLIALGIYFCYTCYLFFPKIFNAHFWWKNTVNISTLAALSFALVATTFLCITRRSLKSKILFFFSIASTFFAWSIFFIGLGGILTYFNQQVAEFLLPNSTTTKLWTSFFLVILSTGILARILVQWLQDTSLWQKSIPYLIFNFFFISASCFSFGVWADKVISVDHLIEIQVNEIKNDLVQELRKNVFNVKIIAKELSILPLSEEEQWSAYLQLNIQDNPAWTGLQIYDAKLKLKHQSTQTDSSVLPFISIPAPLVQMMQNNPQKKTFLSLYTSASSPQSSQIIVASPIYKGTSFQGVVIADIDLKRFSHFVLLEKEIENYVFTASVEGEPFISINLKKKTPKSKVHTSTFHAYDLNWTISIGPTEQYLYSQSTFLLWVSIFGGSIISCSLGGLAFLWQKSKNQFEKIVEIQNSLSENKLKIDIAISSAEIGFWKWDIKNKLVDLDDRTLYNFGLKTRPRVIRLEDVKNWILPEDQEPFEKTIQSSLAEKIFKPLEFRVQWPDGSIHTLHGRGKLFLGSDGSPNYVIGAGWDSSELYITKKELQETQERLKIFVDTINEWIWETDSQGRFTYSNPIVTSLLGYTPTDLIGNHFENFVSKEDVEGCKALFTHDKENKQPVFNRVTRWKHKNGTFVWVETNYVPFFSPTNQLLGFRYASRDITERKKIERMKGEFLSNVSHELRTPLTSIYGSLGLLVGKYKQEFSAKVQEMLDIALRNAERLLNLIDQLLNLQKIERGKIEYFFTAFPIKKMVEESVRLNQALAHHADITLQIKEPLSDSIVNADYDRLIEVMANLISNAVKFSYPKGVVTVSTTDKEKTVQVLIIDTGKGIPLEFQSQVFQRFAQADTSKGLPGAGLGLNICKSIMKSLKGTIAFTSELGKGTTFYFELPRYDTSNNQPSEKKAAPKT